MIGIPKHESNNLSLTLHIGHSVFTPTQTKSTIEVTPCLRYTCGANITPSPWSLYLSGAQRELSLASVRKLCQILIATLCLASYSLELSGKMQPRDVWLVFIPTSHNPAGICCYSRTWQPCSCKLSPCSHVHTHTKLAHVIARQALILSTVQHRPVSWSI